MSGRTSGVFGGIYFLGYLILGLFQLAATFTGIDAWLHLHWLINGPVSLVIAYIPIVGTIAGIMGAHYSWGWSWLAAVALFFGPQAIILFIALLVTGAEKVKRS